MNQAWHGSYNYLFKLFEQLSKTAFLTLIKMVDSSSSKALIISMVGPLMNKVKMSILGARKNCQLALKLSSTIDMLGEQLLPHYLTDGSRS